MMERTVEGETSGAFVALDDPLRRLESRDWLLRVVAMLRPPR
jgi:hypothetical protein